MVVAIAGTALAVGASAYSAASQSSAAQKAAETQATGANRALDLQREMYEQQREDIAPWREAGAWALPRMQEMIEQGPGAPFRGPRGLDPRQFAFRAPDPSNLANDPGYQFRLKSGQQALEGSAAARGGLLSGGAARALTTFGQELGSQEYQNVYNRALGRNELRYGRALTANQDAYNRALQAWQSGQLLDQTQYNRLAGLSGTGQTSTQYLGGLGAQYAQNAGNLITDKATALSMGQIGSANAWSNFAQSIGSAAGNLGGFYTGGGLGPQQAGYNPYQQGGYPP